MQPLAFEKENLGEAAFLLLQPIIILKDIIPAYNKVFYPVGFFQQARCFNGDIHLIIQVNASASRQNPVFFVILNNGDTRLPWIYIARNTVT